MQQIKGTKGGGVERPIRTALVVRPVIKEDLRHDLKELEVRQGEAGGYELLLPDGTRVGGSGLAIYGAHALDGDSLCHDLVEELIMRAFHGETGAVLAMGQTGSGKSHLMGTECRRGPAGIGGGEGPRPNSVGQFVPRRIFELARKQQLESFEVECAMVEVYSQKQHDSVRDLLAIGRPQIDKPAAPLKNLQWFPAPDAQELQSKLIEGSDARETSRTMGNNRSSRSHAIFMIKMAQMRREEGGALQKVTAQLMLVDLAGSEQAALAVASSTTFKEGAGINLGLLSLGGVIEDLARGNPPQYNDGALTRILKPALGGTANAVIVGCISPLVAHLEYTKRTLLYISKAGTIKNTVRADVRAIRRAGGDSEEVRAHAAEVAELRVQLERLRQAQAQASSTADTVVLTRVEHQRLVQQAELERLRADSLDTMLRHVTARLNSASSVAAPAPAAPAAVALAAPVPTAPAAAAAVTGDGEAGPSLPAAATAAAAAEGAGSGVACEPPAEGNIDPAAPARHEESPDFPVLPLYAQLASSSSSNASSAQQQRRQQQQPQQQEQAQPPSYHHIAIVASPVLSALEGAVAAAGESDESSEEEAGAGAAELGGASLTHVCLEKESNLQPEQLDLLKVSLDQEQRSMRRKRAQQAQQRLGAAPGGGGGAAAPESPPPPAPPRSAAEVRGWARGVAEGATSGAGWQFVVDSLQHELGYLRQRLNTTRQQGAGASAGPAAVAAQLPALEAEVAAVEGQLREAQLGQRAAEAALRDDPARLLGWLGAAPGGVPAEQVAAALLAELIDMRLRARQLERQLFLQRLAGASLELSLRTYNKCLGEVEEELQDAAAEIQVLRKEQEEFKQAIEEKMRYVQQAAAAQTALELLHAQVRQLEKQLATVRLEAQHAQQPAPSRSFTSAIRSWASLGRSPAGAPAGGLTPESSYARSQGSLSAQPSRAGSRAGSLPGSPRASLGAGLFGSGCQASPGTSLTSSPTRRTYPGSPRASMGGDHQPFQYSPLGKIGGRGGRMSEDAAHILPDTQQQHQQQQGAAQDEQPAPSSPKLRLWVPLWRSSSSGGGGAAPAGPGDAVQALRIDEDAV